MKIDKKLDAAKKKALREYGKKIKEKGSRAGEPIIQKHLKIWPDFRQWAYALGIMLRSDELLAEALAEANVTPLIMLYPKAKKWYVATRYRKEKDGMIVSIKKYDVTDQIKEILRQHGRKRGRK